MSTQFAAALFACMIIMLLVGYLLGVDEAKRAEQRDWHRHVQSAMWVARRSL
jgi:hypothetical protein